MEINSLESSISRLYESFAVEENRSWFDCKAVGARVNKMVFELGSKDGDTFNPRLSRKKKAKKKIINLSSSSSLSSKRNVSTSPKCLLIPSYMHFIKAVLFY